MTLTDISIHALRVEGDKQIADALAAAEDFYPRPPGGGRQGGKRPVLALLDFYPRPPGGGRRKEGETFGVMLKISIHALRVEGDANRVYPQKSRKRFLSTPSGWRATA